KVLLLNAGADDYVTKPFSTPEFVARVRAVLRRARLGGAIGDHGPAVIEAYGLVIDVPRRRVARGQTVIRLTPIEWDILRTLVAHAGRTLTHQQIFDAVWGSALGSPQQYLRVHVTNLRRKIEVNPAQPELIVTEPGVGYRAELPGEPRSRRDQLARLDLDRLGHRVSHGDRVATGVPRQRGYHSARAHLSAHDPGREREWRSVARLYSHVRGLPVDRLFLPGAVRPVLGRQAARLVGVAVVPHDRGRDHPPRDPGARARRGGRP